jgi:hypothetical protein
LNEVQLRILAQKRPFLQLKRGNFGSPAWLLVKASALSWACPFTTCKLVKTPARFKIELPINHPAIGWFIMRLPEVKEKTSVTI